MTLSCQRREDKIIITYWRTIYAIKIRNKVLHGGWLFLFRIERNLYWYYWVGELITEIRSKRKARGQIQTPPCYNHAHYLMIIFFKNKRWRSLVNISYWLNVAVVKIMIKLNRNFSSRLLRFKIYNLLQLEKKTSQT